MEVVWNRVTVAPPLKKYAHPHVGEYRPKNYYIPPTKQSLTKERWLVGLCLSNLYM